MALNISRRIQQSVVIHPVDDESKALTITVKESIPGRVVLSFYGRNFAVTRAEIYGTKAQPELTGGEQ